MKCTLVTAATAALLLAVVIPAGAESQSVPGGDEPLAVLIVTGGERPVRIRLDVRYGGRPWREHFTAVRDVYFRGLFAQLDGNADGRLDRNEAVRAPRPRVMIDGQRADEVHIAFNFRVMDGDGDGGVSPEELQAYYAESEDDPLQHASSAAPVRSDALFVCLDRDGDGVIRPDDLAQFDTLLDRDLDRNRVLTEEELRGPRVSYGREFVARPFRRRSADESSPLSVRIVRDDGSPADAALHLDLAPNSSGHIPTPSLEVLTDLAIEADAEPGTVAMRLFGRRIEVRVVPPPVRGVERVADTLQREFLAADVDADAQVDMSPDLPRFLRESFGLLDHGADGRLDQAELTAYCRDFLPLSAALGGARISITAHEEVRGLLALADLDRDGRLGARELQRARDLASGLMPANGELTADRLPPVVRVDLHVAGVELPYVDDAAAEPGPPWFVRADVNRDGDVDRHEFLGSHSDFQRVDQDGDGLISLAEAARFDAVARTGVSAALEVDQHLETPQ